MGSPWPHSLDSDYATGFSNLHLKQVPVLCYHNIKDDPLRENLLTISTTHFGEQLKMLYDSGYHTILPEQLIAYLQTGKELPAKPIMLTFDDTHEEDFSIARPILDRYKFKAVFFIMTVCIDKHNYLTSAQIRELSDGGHIIANHTWDHPNIKKVKGHDWVKEIDKPELKLEKITGKPVKIFAYPYGAWDDASIAELKERHVVAAFQLSAHQSLKEPLFTIRRMMVSGEWTPPELQRQMEKTFR